ncbi:MAG: hypothetical protein JWL77_7086 [Chthonomonadaceae bacterium]|nr:hypothetical protein [Chthonomonadaceae bacterium]
MTGRAAAPAQHAARSPQTEEKLDARHVVWEFEPNLPLAELLDVEGNQVRRSEHRAPREMVERYTEQMKNGAVFPAIVVNDRHELVDGNTRSAAARSIGRETIAAYVCADLTSLRARSLSVELNQAHGLSMSEDEIRAFVESAVDAGQVLDTKAYARMTGKKPRTLSRWVAAHAFRRRADRADELQGLPVDRLPETVQVALHTIKLRAVFVAATRLALDARVNATDMKALVREVEAAPSETAARAVVEAARRARAEDIGTIAAGFRVAKRRSTGAAPHLAGLLKFTPEDLLDVAPDRQAEALDRMRELHERLEAAIRQASSAWAPPMAGVNGSDAS